MKAMILAAGLGTRLKPFTDLHPKALFEVEGKTLLEHSLLHLKHAGIHEVIINVHHFAVQIIDFLRQHENFGLKITISDETGELLETGGGVKKAAWFFTGNESAVIRNVDILSDLDLLAMELFHRESHALATLAVRDRQTSRYLLFDRSMQLCGWENITTGERKISRDAPLLSPFAFSGIQVISPEIFSSVTEKGRFSLTGMYLRLAAGQKILGYLDEGKIWKDVGRMTANGG
ncbi:MAG: nucleotidyltransferase family protein [Bacteroidota bacterium]